jgi:hypothetical protein
MPNFLRAHQEAFERFGGVPRTVLYDNLRSAVLERYGDAIRFNPELLRFAAHYRYEPRPVAKARGNEKGRVERAIRYARQSFFLARSWRDLADLNRQADEWAQGPAARRLCPEDRTRTVQHVFEAERDALIALPSSPYPVHERVEVQIGRTPYARFDKNDYSVPHTLVRRRLTLVASPEQVRLLDGDLVVATHPRSYDKAQQIEDSAHVAALVAHKRKARQHRGMNALYCCAAATFRSSSQIHGSLGDVNVGS